MGYEIFQRRRSCGDESSAATDIAVRLGMAGGVRARSLYIDEGFAKKAMAVMREMVRRGIDMMKVSNDDIDAILVDGSCIILPTDLAPWHRDLRGSSSRMRERGVRHLEGEKRRHPMRRSSIMTRPLATRRSGRFRAARRSRLLSRLALCAGNRQIIDSEDVPLCGQLPRSHQPCEGEGRLKQPLSHRKPLKAKAVPARGAALLI